MCVYGHLDVQPAALEDGWDSEPFTLVERDGRSISWRSGGVGVVWTSCLQSHTCFRTCMQGVLWLFLQNQLFSHNLELGFWMLPACVPVREPQAACLPCAARSL